MIAQDHAQIKMKATRYFNLPLLFEVKPAHARNRFYYFLIADRKRQNGNSNQHQHSPDYPSRQIGMPARWCLDIAIIWQRPLSGRTTTHRFSCL
tara:strand:- start:221 stop:502 length:282 start_codon:yes stop_codon:yes gene_type:complete